MRVRSFALAVAAAIVTLGFAAPGTAAAADCETLQNSYAAVVSQTYARARALGIKDSDFVSLRDALQEAGKDGQLTDTELLPLAGKYPVLVSVATNEADKALIQDLIKKYNAYVAASCDKTNGDADAGTGPSASATPKASATSKSSASTTKKATASSSSGAQVSVLPNDAPETGDGSTVQSTWQSAMQLVAAISTLLLVSLGGLVVAARRSRS